MATATLADALFLKFRVGFFGFLVATLALLVEGTFDVDFAGFGFLCFVAIKTLYVSAFVVAISAFAGFIVDFVVKIHGSFFALYVVNLDILRLCSLGRSKRAGCKDDSYCQCRYCEKKSAFHGVPPSLLSISNKAILYQQQRPLDDSSHDYSTRMLKKANEYLNIRNHKACHRKNRGQP
jgi:hypothetical protein